MTSNQLVRPRIYQFTFGDSVVTTILEGYAHRNDLHPFVATNAKADEVEAVANRYRIPFPSLEHNFVTTVIKTPEKLIVFDPGFGQNSPMTTAGFFNEALNQAGYSIDEVDLVVVSHFHPDHFGNLLTDGKPTFENAQYVFGKTEFEYWQKGENVSEMRQPTLALFNKVALPLADKARFIEPDEEIVSGLRSVEAFGHSAGHMCFQFVSGQHELLLLNDTVPHYVASLAHPEWYFSMDDFPEQAAITRERIVSGAAKSKVPVIGFHFPFPSIGFIESAATGFEFRPATYQFNLQPS